MGLLGRKPQALPDCADWIIDGRLAAMCMPTREELEHLRELGFALVINLTEKPGPTQMAASVGLKGAHLPLEDGAAPTLEDILVFVQTVDRYLSREMPVMVHCMGGVGRTGTMNACYLVSRGMAAWPAIEEVRKRRPGSIETLSQERAVIEYARYLWEQKQER